MKKNRFVQVWLWIALLLLLPSPVLSADYPVSFTDDSGRTITISRRPALVVSLVPSLTEIIFRIGAGDALAGITRHDTRFVQASQKAVVGGFYSPSIRLIKQLKPDLIFYSKFHAAVKRYFSGGESILVNLEIDSISDSYETIRLLGKIFGKKSEAERIIAENREELALISKKIAKIPLEKRRRVIRLMGRKRVMAPGDDSFQNELIRAAGGIPPELGKRGGVVPVSLEKWRAFNPQFIYGCGGDSLVAKKFFSRAGWRDVDAVKRGTVKYFPCDLTCRCATRTGYFVSWLSSSIYPDLFGEKAYQVLEDGIRSERRIVLPLSYVRDARIATSRIDDFTNKSLVIDFDRPMTLLSTLEGVRRGITSVGNHYSSPPCWSINHGRGYEKVRDRILGVLGKKAGNSSFLFTGADMEHLSIASERFRDIGVHALVTAGVRSNAVRMGKDSGNYYEPGTINIILLPEVELSPRAMARAVISATEAKSAALSDLDIRSSYSPLMHRATGTGTDNMIVVQGRGIRIENTGGHSKMGELIARAVYRGVKEAVYRQNSITSGRDVFQRLSERRISINGLVDESACDCLVGDNMLEILLERLLLDPRYADFIKASLVLSDEYEKGTISGLSFFESACRRTAEEIAQRPVDGLKDLVGPKNLPRVIRLAFNSLLNGIYHRESIREESKGQKP